MSDQLTVLRLFNALGEAAASTPTMAPEYDEHSLWVKYLSDDGALLEGESLSETSDSAEVGDALLAAGADRDARDAEGKTAIEHARERGEDDKVELLS
jgi:hypothetical protein